MPIRAKDFFIQDETYYGTKSDRFAKKKYKYKYYFYTGFNKTSRIRRIGLNFIEPSSVIGKLTYIETIRVHVIEQ